MSLRFPKPTPRWLERRQKRLDESLALRQAQTAVRKRDGGKCRSCGKPGVHVHHITFRSKGGTHDPSGLVLLCQSCHSAVHGHALHISSRAGALVFEWVKGS